MALDEIRGKLLSRAVMIVIRATFAILRLPPKGLCDIRRSSSPFHLPFGFDRHPLWFDLFGPEKKIVSCVLHISNCSLFRFANSKPLIGAKAKGVATDVGQLLDALLCGIQLRPFDNANRVPKQLI